MTHPKIQPCKCGNDDLAIYEYGYGWQHVECDDCHYMGPARGSKLGAIRAHNERIRALPDASKGEAL
ncbi:MAG TPA: hypothetical protein PKD48_02095 [Sphingopyxis sp.]|nr:hypothetical protein [Sphingopyxis sp.]